ncbi:hypothetical protein BCT47_11960 [Vibrio splendidus]|jgi:hypothetical protein|nr:hypothetical protein A6D94_03845 [Vibrio splendidus]OEE91703.1 hypothetical protein A140_02000 [Vibrio crassostreae 9ZC88]OEE98991.1 hypothetical protein A136_20105 [Vibrio crassostreae 9ZC13]OEF04751.1 hypothetical protein A138_14340 [Vibrio crassostreae 9ZC77]PMK09220.1 hypothetical protein BCU07_16240 [Vibrio sp. 10N.261.54.E10]TKF70328.1 hypothetical protein FCV55_10820 [Vibrio sp. F13]
MIKVRDSYLTEHKWLECHGIQGIELKDFDAHLDALFMMTFFWLSRRARAKRNIGGFDLVFKQ